MHLNGEKIVKCNQMGEKLAGSMQLDRKFYVYEKKI